MTNRIESPRSPVRDPMHSQYGRSKVGFPIRKSLDQSSFAAPQGLSQRTTSFIASQRQGIHRMLLRHLIALMIDGRHLAGTRRQPSKVRRLGKKRQTIRKTCPWISPRTFACQRIRLSEVRRSEDQKIRSSDARPRWFVGSLRQSRMRHLFTMSNTRKRA